MVEKTTGIPLTVGSPSVGIFYHDNQLNALTQLYNNTPVASLENSFRRRLKALPSQPKSCEKPTVRALATDTVASVIEKCQYISKPGTDSKLTLRIARGLNGKPTVQQIGAIETCGTYHDLIHVSLKYFFFKSPRQCFLIFIFLNKSAYPSSHFLFCR